jgi:uncharacterized protein
MSEATPLAPVAAGERVAAIDVLRGAAVLGILTINIGSFGLPDAVFQNPAVAGGFTGANFGAWLGCHLLFEQKAMSVFSMLFGAGLVLQTRRADARGASLAGTYYRRVGWLLVFGLLHAFLLWEGDILTAYALCGLVLYPFRRLAPRALIALGLAVFLLAVPLNVGAGLAGRAASDDAASAEDEATAREGEDLAADVRAHRGGYWELFRYRARQSLWMQTVFFALWAGPRAGGLMLLGAGLMKLGVFTAARSFRFYAALAAVGYGAGLPVVGWGAYDLVRHHFDETYQSLIGGHFNYVGSLLVALGHVGTVMLVCKAGALPRLTARLAAVGRMALTNYLAQTLLCTTLFYGYGLGLFDRLDRVRLLGVVAAVWLLQLAYSPVWLRHFRYGPAEWLWRSLTYMRRQPMRPGRADVGASPAGEGDDGGRRAATSGPPSAGKEGEK